MAAMVRYGTASTSPGDQYVGKTVRELRSMLSDQLGLHPGAPAVVSSRGGDGEPVAEDYRVNDGDVLEFVRPAGTKG